MLDVNQRDDHSEHDRSEHGDAAKGGHDHHHEPERGWLAGLRYIKMVPKFWRSDVNEAVVDLVDPAPSEQLLDIGAGLGAASVVAVKALDTGSVTAVDPLPFMRSVLKARRVWPGRWRRLRVAEGTAEALPVPDSSVDAAWATNAMHHFDDLEAAAVELARVLKPGGRAVFVEEQFTDPRHPSYESFGGNQADDHEHRFHAVDLAHVSETMEAAGLEVVEAADTLVAGVPAKLIRLSYS